MTVDKFIEIIVALAPSISAVLVVYIAQSNSRRVKKKDAVNQRLDNFYIPFMRMCIESSMYRIDFTELDEDVEAMNFVDLLQYNFQFTDTETQLKVINFMNYYHLLKYKNY